jgi:hypothetical protein
LNTGERKAISSDKVVVVPGPPEQLAVIRRIFGLYVRHQLPVTEIVERLARAGIKDSGDKPLGVSTVRNILSNELCIGQMTYNLTTSRLQGKKSRTVVDKVFGLSTDNIDETISKGSGASFSDRTSALGQTGDHRIFAEPA